MVVSIEIRNATAEDVDHVVKHCRDADRREFSYAIEDGKSLYGTVLEMRHRSHRCFTGLVNDVPVIVYGIVPQSIISSPVAFPWAICSSEIEQSRNKRVFVKMAKDELERLTKGYADLRGIVHEYNHVAKHWLKWMGFTIEDERVVLNDGGFHRFNLEKGRLPCVR